MREKKQTRTLRRMMSLLLAVMLIAGLFPAESIQAVETETTMETEENTESPEAEETPTPSETAAPSPSAEPAESPEPGITPEEPEETEPTYEGSISGVLWIDSNTDGIYDGDEEPLADYPVYLYAEGDTDNAVQTATTDAAGKYLFEEIETGRYVVGVKAEENGTKFLLPLVGVQKDNKFYFTPDYSKVISNPIDIDTDTVVENVDAGMRTPPGIQPMAYTTYTIDLATVTTATAPAGTTFSGSILTFTGVDTTDNYIITTSASTARYIVVNSGETVNMTLNGVTISSTVSPFRLLGTANVNLTLSGTNILTCTGTSTTIGVYQAGLHVAQTAALTIDGTGTLNATGGTWGAGIGGCYMGASAGNVANSSGKITITDGTVTAKGGSNGAGIGGGMYGKGTITIINGGTVTATGGDNGAGIGDGAGYIFSDSTINITGGTVMATGGSNGAGIGGGSGGTGVTINITGGTVMATGGGNGAGIGDGGLATSSSGNITINGGTVTATGGTNAMDIGRGGSSSSTSIGLVVITGGSVFPTRGASYVGPTPTNGSANGNDVVGMLTFTQFAGQDFSIVAGGTLSSYTYKGTGHAAAGYLWLTYPGVSTEVATSLSTTAAVVTAPSTVNSAASSTATLNGKYYLNNTYAVTSAYFEYGTTTSYGITRSITPIGTITTAIQSAAATLTGLLPGTVYNYRFVIVTNGITVRGSNMTFTTPSLAPSVDVTHSAVTSTTATLSGIYALNGGTFSSGLFQISSNSGSTWSTPTGGTLTGATTTPTVNLAGLTPGTTFQYRLTVTNSIGSTIKTGSFTTLPAAPTVNTPTVTGITSTNASVTGTFNLNSGTLSSGSFYYGTVTSPTTQKTWDSSTTTSATSSLSSLTPNTRYYVRNYVSTNGGNVYSSDASFVTSPATPTLSASATSATGASITGAISSAGNQTYSVLIEYSEDSTFATGVTTALTTTSGTSWTPTLTGLTGSTTYHVRITFTNTSTSSIQNAGQSTTATTSFTTPAPYVDVTVSKTVTGTYADTTKAFDFTMYFEDSIGASLASGTQLTYTGGIIAGSGATAPLGGTLTLDSAGKAVFPLKDGQTITITGVAANGKVRIVETADSNYSTSFKDNEDAGSTTGNDTSVRSMNSADRTFAFTNARSGVVPGGIDAGSGILLLLALLAVLAALAITVVHHRRVRRR